MDCFFKVCLESYKLIGELSAKTMSFSCPASFAKTSSKLLDEWPTKAIGPHAPTCKQVVLITVHGTVAGEILP